MAFRLAVVWKVVEAIKQNPNENHADVFDRTWNETLMRMKGRYETNEETIR